MEIHNKSNDHKQTLEKAKNLLKIIQTQEYINGIYVRNHAASLYTYLGPLAGPIELVFMHYFKKKTARKALSDVTKEQKKLTKLINKLTQIVIEKEK